MPHTICLIPGDGIGPAVTEADCEVLAAAGAPIDWIRLDAGAAALDRHGEILPRETVDAIAAPRLALKGPITTPVGHG